MTWFISKGVVGSILFFFFLFLFFSFFFFFIEMKKLVNSFHFRDPASPSPLPAVSQELLPCVDPQGRIVCRGRTRYRRLVASRDQGSPVYLWYRVRLQRQGLPV